MTELHDERCASRAGVGGRRSAIELHLVSIGDIVAYHDQDR